MKRLFAALAAGLLCAGAVCDATRAADEYAVTAVSSQPLSDDQIDKTFDQIFAMQQKITRMQAKVTTIKKGGGIFARSSVTVGYAFAKMPDCLLFVDRGSPADNLPENQWSTILIDGVYLWDIKPGETEGSLEAERLAVKNAGDRDINIAALLIGADVATGRQLREYYLLTGSLDDLGAKGKSYHFGLKTIPGKEKKNVTEDVEVWIRPGEVIPWRITNIRKAPKVNVLGDEGATAAAPTFKTTESTKEISELQTNLSTPPLPEFPAERFFFGELMRKYPTMKVIDARGQEMDKAQLQQELQNLYSRLKQPAAK